MEFRSVVSGATYHVQVRYRSVRGVEGSLAEDLGLVTVGTSISGGVTQIGGQTPQELIDQLNETTQLGQETSEQAAQTANDLLFTNQNLYESTHLDDGTPLETYVLNSVSSGEANNAYSITRVDAMGILRPDGRTFQLSDVTLYADPTQTWAQYKNSLQTGYLAGTPAAITWACRPTGSMATARSRPGSIKPFQQRTAIYAPQSITKPAKLQGTGLIAQWVLSR